MVKLINVLFKMRLLSPLGLYSLISAVFKYGMNLMALLSFAERIYASKTVLVDEDETLSYEQLWSQSERVSLVLKESYQLRSGQKVGFLCKNHVSLVKSIFAVSQLGADIYLLNTEMSLSQFNNFVVQHDFDFLVYDFELSSKIEQSSYSKDRILSYHNRLTAINTLLNTTGKTKLKSRRSSSSKIMILTGGTTGNPKAAAHKPSLLNYINPFLTMLTRLKLINYNTVFIATPIYHGYGVAMLLLFIALGKKVVINNGFEVKKACTLIREHNVEVVTVVPLMVYKMLKHNAEDLKSLSCIVSGGAELNPKLVIDIYNTLGEVVYNLYGTSEAGLNTIATPQDLLYSTKTVGKKIEGVHLKILDENKNEVNFGNVGQLCIKNKWSMRNSKSSWIETGDLGYRDCKGYYFLCGRVDDMVVSAGENVYPVEIEQALINHPQVEDAAVIGINDEGFGQRLKAYVLPKKNADLTEKELLEWLTYRIAKFQMPKEIAFVNHLPYTSLGKLDKKQLKMK
ncbi:AMP-binding protein [Desulfosporosinus nitroreducens]|uniref:AMP-binding protein n=1 Tax=Desulfosporosinus nitroreducens TaxID=2018668 RepID=A0ABT8QJF0_9FIRM|nr:AMP-binding protein [Desulfosporosinus nitroreducens]MCO1600351.1 AMP-binding protein [Desulfosporosinus nitroreducens]MDO0821439.1 AMP-binding protein [Desulfosporosinus nitroreducens]